MGQIQPADHTCLGFVNSSDYLALRHLGKSILQVPDTGTRVLANTGPFLHSSIVSF